MLVLSRKPGESIVIAGNIVVTILKNGRIGIEAPRECRILRKEVADRTEEASDDE